MNGQYIAWKINLTVQLMIPIEVVNVNAQVIGHYLVSMSGQASWSINSNLDVENDAMQNYGNEEAAVPKLWVHDSPVKENVPGLARHYHGKANKFCTTSFKMNTHTWRWNLYHQLISSYMKGWTKSNQQSQIRMLSSWFLFFTRSSDNQWRGLEPSQSQN